jgi:dTDP-3-amino-3,4,6-trideoxy-alpha-D-glucose transaminase
VLAAGASLTVADVDPATLLLTRETAEAAWTPGVRAVICVHLYGRPCPLPELTALCAERGAVLIQDCCQAHGATWQGRPFTAFSPYCAYSFYPTKNLGGVGDGGAVLSGDPATLDLLRMLRDGGRRNDQTARLIAPNARLDEIQSCYLRALLPLLPELNQRRREQAEIYDRELGFVRPVSGGPDSVHHLYVVRTPARDEVRRRLEGLGVQSGVHYPVPVHLQPGFSNVCQVVHPPRHAEQAALEILSLPIGPHLSASDARRVCQAMREVAA